METKGRSKSSNSPYLLITVHQ